MGHSHREPRLHSFCRDRPAEQPSGAKNDAERRSGGPVGGIRARFSGVLTVHPV